ncbi:MAG: YcaO-like family protein [Proteobacteria bacterium]|nr:YcaO-like family protein [Pseudomonadota bacterium]
MVGNLTAYTRYSGNNYDFASTGIHPERINAYMAAFGEGIERYCGFLSNMQPQKITTYANLLQDGLPALPPEKFHLFIREQYSQPYFPFTLPGDETVLSWIKGYFLIKHKPVYVPSAFVFNQYKPVEGEPRLCPDIHPGMACGPSLSSALLAALYEIVERDALMVFWLNLVPMPGIEIQKDKRWGQTIGKYMTANHPEISLLWLQSDLNIPVVFCLLVDETEGVVSGGCAARLDPYQAATKAVCESVQTWLLAIEIKKGKHGKLASHERRYAKGLLDPDKRDQLPGTQLLFNLVHYLNHKNWSLLKTLRHPEERLTFKDLPSPETGYIEDDLRYVFNEFRRHKLEPIVVNVTTQDVADAGWYVVRVLVPGAVPNTPTDYPPLALKRLREVPVRLGYQSLEEKGNWNLSPMPYA